MIEVEACALPFISGPLLPVSILPWIASPKAGKRSTPRSSLEGLSIQGRVGNSMSGRSRRTNPIG